MSKYVDIPSTMHVLGNIYNDLSLVNNEQYPLQLADFSDNFQKALYSSFYELWNLGNKSISEVEILDFISTRPKIEAIFNQNNGIEYLKEISKTAQISSFEYYYKRVKKMSLLRAYDDLGVDVSGLYDPENILDPLKRQAQEDWFDRVKIEDIANIIEDKMLEIHAKYIDNSTNEAVDAAEGLEDLVNRMMESPDYGYPLYGAYINTVHRGARLGCFYLRSASSGVGKSRSLVADACYVGCDRFYDEVKQKWIFTNEPADTLLITTEQDISEIQTMMLAFISGVPEERILTGLYMNDNEIDRIVQSIEVIKNGKIKLESLSDFSINDIENTIKRAIRKFNTQYVFLDYIHTSLKILDELTSRSGGVKLREDLVLFMISDKLKQIAKNNGVFVESATQLNGDYAKGVLDQNALRGAKAIADKIDVGMIMVETSQKDIEALSPILSQRPDFPTPKIKIAVYKNRRSKWKNLTLWCDDRRDCCRINPLFATKNDFELLDNFVDTHINISPEGEMSTEEKDKFKVKSAY